MSEPVTATIRSAGRRTGALVQVVLGAALLIAVNAWPGWTAVPFLTADTERVVGLFNLPILLGVAVNMADAVADRLWLRHGGDVVTSSVGFAVSWQVLQVFPFRFAGTGFDWAVLVRVLLVIGLVGSAIGLIAGVVRLVRYGLGAPGA